MLGGHARYLSRCSSQRAKLSLFRHHAPLIARLGRGNEAMCAKWDGGVEASRYFPLPKR